MRQRIAMKAAGNRLVDDVTKLNSGLNNRLNVHPDIRSAWFFNGSVFASDNVGKRFKFDLYDSIQEVLTAHPTFRP